MFVVWRSRGEPHPLVLNLPLTPHRKPFPRRLFYRLGYRRDHQRELRMLMGKSYIDSLS